MTRSDVVSCWLCLSLPENPPQSLESSWQIVVCLYDGLYTSEITGMGKKTKPGVEADGLQLFFLMVPAFNWLMFVLSDDPYGSFYQSDQFELDAG